MAKLNLDIHIFKNNSIILEGNSPITNSHMEILNDFEVIYLGCAFNQSLEGLHNGIKAIRFYLNDEFYIRWNSRLYKNMDYNDIIIITLLVIIIGLMLLKKDYGFFTKTENFDTNLTKSTVTLPIFTSRKNSVQDP